MWGLTLWLVKPRNIFLRKLKLTIIDILAEKYLQKLAADLLWQAKSPRICLYFSCVLSLQKWNVYFHIFNDALPLSSEITQHWRLYNKLAVSNEKMVIHSDSPFHLEDNNLKIISASPAFSSYIWYVSRNSFEYTNKQILGAISEGKCEQAWTMLKKIKIILKTHRKINFHHYYARLLRICTEKKARGRKPKMNICKYPDKPIFGAHSHVSVLGHAVST